MDFVNSAYQNPTYDSTAQVTKAVTVEQYMKNLFDKKNIDVNILFLNASRDYRSCQLDLATSGERIALYEYEVNVGVTEVYAKDLYPYFLGENKDMLDSLPEELNPETRPYFVDVIDKIGTHLVTSVQSGGKIRAKVRLSEESEGVVHLTESQKRTGIGINLGDSVFGSAGRTRTTEEIELSNSVSSAMTFSTEVIGGDHTSTNVMDVTTWDSDDLEEWIASVFPSPDEINYQVEPVWRFIQNEAAKQNMKLVYEQYVGVPGVNRNAIIEAYDCYWMSVREMGGHSTIVCDAGEWVHNFMATHHDGSLYWTQEIECCKMRATV